MEGALWLMLPGIRCHLGQLLPQQQQERQKQEQQKGLRQQQTGSQLQQQHWQQQGLEQLRRLQAAAAWMVRCWARC